MATIQIKRKTSSGTGPLVGAGTIKAGEPLIDLNGGNLYVSKADKTGTSGAPIAASDYIEFYSRGNADSAIDSKISALGLKGASKFDVGTTAGKIPVVSSDGKLKASIIPQIAITDTFVVSSQAAMLALSTAQVGDIAVRTDLSESFILKAEGYSTLANWQELLTPTDKVTSVNGKTGTVTVTLSELGGVSASAYDSHVSSSLHLTDAQRTKLTNMYLSDIKCGSSNAAVAYSSTLAGVTGSCISGGLRLYYSLNSSYNPAIKSYYIGIDSSKVLTPTSVIDGGTY
jgi:hypothetical protein